jgi:hypothetical protein
MELEDFQIGQTFFASAGFEWLCTDKGTRTITAIRLDPYKDPSWFIGPPYSVDEIVFDQYDMQSCYSNTKNMLVDRIESSKKSSHPGFDVDDVFEMMKEKHTLHSANPALDTYHRKNIMKRDRIGDNGEILHPYSAIRKENGWHIKTFELFSREYSEIHEDEFVKLKFSDEEAMKARKEAFEKSKL